MVVRLLARIVQQQQLLLSSGVFPVERHTHTSSKANGCLRQPVEAQKQAAQPCCLVFVQLMLAANWGRPLVVQWGIQCNVMACSSGSIQASMVRP
jgi:hypothetical protein